MLDKLENVNSLLQHNRIIMSKILYCYKCSKKIAEIVKGNIQKGASGICNECLTKKDIKKAADNFASLGKKNNPLSDLLNGMNIDDILK